MVLAGEALRVASRSIGARLVLFPIAKVLVDTATIRRSCNSAYLQRLGLPCHAEYALTSDHSL
jgi:hypothetical protein